MKKTSPIQPELKVKVFSPYQVYFQGTAVSLSAASKKGPFDILAGHANFFSLLVAGPVKVDTGYQQLTFYVDHGLIKVSQNQVTLYANV